MFGGDQFIEHPLVEVGPTGGINLAKPLDREIGRRGDQAQVVLKQLQLQQSIEIGRARPPSMPSQSR